MHLDAARDKRALGLDRRMPRVATIQVGTSRGRATSARVGGVRRWLSRTTRTGERCSRPGSRTVSSGSSARTVPTPTMIASCMGAHQVDAARSRPRR